jgi:Ser/Thr protein kinase RdoA (MazF antagonist)
MKSAQIAYLCTACDLGVPLGTPRAVPGGSLHETWRLDTTQGTYAVKQLNPALLGQPGMTDLYQQTERIAAKIAAHGLPAVTAIDRQGEVLQRYEDDVFLVSRWMDGEALLPDDITLERLQQVGAMLARLHALPLPQAELPPLNWKPFSDDDWDMLTIHAADLGVPWAYQVRAMMPRLVEWGKWYEEASEHLNYTLVVSHRNLDPENVLWRGEDGFSIVDWESAGLINPVVDLVETALIWSGLTTGAPSAERFAALMQGYVQAGGMVQETGRNALRGCLGIWLGWLLFTMYRSLGIAVASDEERQHAIKQTPHVLAIVRMLAGHLELWAEWVDKWL